MFSPKSSTFQLLNMQHAFRIREFLHQQPPSRRCLQMNTLTTHLQYSGPKFNGYQCSCIIWLRTGCFILTSSMISRLLGGLAFILSTMVLAFCTRVIYCLSLSLVEYFQESLSAFTYM